MQRTDHRIFRTARMVLGALAATTLGLSAALAAPAHAAPQPSTPQAPMASTHQLGALGGKDYASLAVLGGVIPGGGPLKASFGRDGRVSFDAGCNRMLGTARTAGDRLTVSGQLAQTLMACPAPRQRADDWVRSFVSVPLTWHLAGPVLSLSSPRQTVILMETMR